MAHITNVSDLRVAVLDTQEEIDLFIDILRQARGRVRIGIDIDGVKADPGHCWGPGIGRLANEAGR